MKNIVLSVIFLLFVLIGNAQNLDEVFDDGGLSEVNGFFSTNITKVIEGNINIGYNKYLVNNKYSVGLAAGYKVFNGYDLFYGNDNIDVDGGYYLELNFYMYDYLYEGFYMGEVIRYNRAHTATKTYNNVELVINLGYRYYLTNRFSIAADIGLSYIFMDYGGMHIPLRINLGMDI